MEERSGKGDGEKGRRGGGVERKGEYEGETWEERGCGRQLGGEREGE